MSAGTAAFRPVVSAKSSQPIQMTLGQGSSTTMLYQPQSETIPAMRPLQPQQQPTATSSAATTKPIRPKLGTSSAASTCSSSISSAFSNYHHSTSAYMTNKPSAAPYPTRQPQTVSVQRRNARERNRVKQVNCGFSTLRQHIPGDVVQALTNGTGGRGASKKLSKVDTLKVAVEYIRRLEDLLDEVVNDENQQMAAGSGSSSSGSLVNYGGGGGASPTPSYASSSVDSTGSVSGSSSQSSQSSQSSSSGSSVMTLPHMQPMLYGKYHHQHHDDVDCESTTVGAGAYDPDDEELLDCITWWQQQ